ncbi:MAG: glycosyltransferase family protein [Halobacteriota archaeon]
MIIAIIQVRMGSTRLPEKALKQILGKPMLWHLINRIKEAKLVDKVVIATTTNKEDKMIINFAKENGIDYYAGSENDIVDRLYMTAKKFGAEAIVRITGDCPLIEPKIIDKAVEYYLKNKDRIDYVSNVYPPTYPDGLDVEIYPFKTLERMGREIKDPFGREWVYTYIIENPDKFRIANIENKEDLSWMRWTVDYKEDLDFVREIYKMLYKYDRIFHMEDILELLRENPKFMEINKKFIRDDAYIKALKEREKIMKSDKYSHLEYKKR